MFRIIITLMLVLSMVFSGVSGISIANAEESAEKPTTTSENLLMMKVNGSYCFHVQVDFDKNKYFSRYDVKLYVDGHEITIIPHGETYDGVLGVSKGYHTLTFAKADNPGHVYGTSQLKITEDSDYACTIHAYWSHVDIQNEVQNGIIVDHAALEKEIFIKLSKKLDYMTACRYPQSVMGEKVKISGKVAKVVDLPLISLSLMALVDGNNIWYVPFTQNPSEGRVLADDTITVYGEFYGISSFYMGNGLIFGSWLAEYPTINAKYIIR